MSFLYLRSICHRVYSSLNRFFARMPVNPLDCRIAACRRKRASCRKSAESALAFCVLVHYSGSNLKRFCEEVGSCEFRSKHRLSVQVLPAVPRRHNLTTYRLPQLAVFTLPISRLGTRSIIWSQLLGGSPVVGSNVRGAISFVCRLRACRLVCTAHQSKH